MSEKTPNPYVGPVPFTINDSNRFYGREGDLRRLMVLFVARRIVLLYSPSGAGKTSLVQAKMSPALERKGFELLPVVRVNRRPIVGSGAINNFVYSTINSLVANEDQLAEPDEASEASPNTPQDVEDDQIAYSNLVHFWQGQREKLGNKRAVLFFDQYEEVLTGDPHDHGQKLQFFDQLGTILEEDDRLWALFAIREDYLAELDPFRHLIPGELRSTYRLELLKEEQAKAAVQKPARGVDVTFSDEAAEKLVGQLRRVTVRHRDGQVAYKEGPFVEPVQLQVVCQTLWEDLEPEAGGTIAAESVAAEGHVDESLGEFYDKTVTKIATKNDMAQRDIRDWFDRQLISEQGLRGQVMGSEDLDLGQDVIDDLVDAHLIRAEERRGIQWYELAHDRLVKPVRQHNETWYGNNLSPLQVRAEAWNKSGDEGLLLQGKELNEAGIWTHGRELRNYEQQFLDTSRDRERAKKARIRNIILVAFFLIILMIGVFLTLLASQQRALASEQNALTAEAQAKESAALARTREAEAQESAAKATIAQGKAETEAKRADENAAEAQMQATAVANQKAEAETQAEKAQTLAFIPLSTSLLPTYRNPFPDEVERSLLMSAHALMTNQRMEQPISTNLLNAQARRLLFYIGSRPTQEILQGEDDINSVAITPDGSLLASASRDGKVLLWNLSDPVTKVRELDGLETVVNSLAFAPDGDWLALAGNDGTVRLLDLSDPEADTLELTSRHTDPVWSVAFELDGDKLASGSLDTTVRVWDLTNLEAEPLILTDHEASVRSVAFSPDGDWLASAGDDLAIRMWNLSNLNAKAVMLPGHKRPVNSVAFAPDGRQLASGSSDRTVRLWDLSDLEAEPKVLQGDDFGVLSVAFSPDGERLASAGHDRTVRLWNLSALEDDPKVLLGHEDLVRSLAFSPEERILVSGSDDWTIRLWDLSDPPTEALILEDHNGPVSSVNFAPDGERLASASQDRMVRVWDLRDTEAKPLILPHDREVWSVAFSPGGERLASASADGIVRLWNLSDLEAEQVMLPHEGSVWSVAFSPDGGWLASAGDNGLVRLWDLNQLEAEPLVLPGQDGTAWSVAFMLDGERLASGSNGGTVRLWNLSNPAAEPQMLEGHKDRVYSVAFSPDGDWLASGSEDGTVRLWNLIDTESDSIILLNHEASVNSVTFAPDGERLAAASSDQSVRLWNLNDLSAEPEVLPDHGKRVRSVAFAPDGDRLASGSDDGTVRIWSTLSGFSDLFCNLAGRNFTFEEWQQYLLGRDYEKACHQYPVHCSVPLEEWPEELADEQSQCNSQS